MRSSSSNSRPIPLRGLPIRTLLWLRRSKKLFSGNLGRKMGLLRARLPMISGFGISSMTGVDFAGSRVRVGLLALPLPGAGVTFFAAAKKVTKESSFSPPAVTRRLAMLASPRWHSPKCRPRRTYRAWLAHGLTNHNLERAGSARKSFGTALRAAVGYAREIIGEEAHANPIDRTAAKRAGAIWC